MSSAAELSEQEKAAFLRATDSTFFQLKTDPGIEKFEKKSMLGSQYLKYAYLVDFKNKAIDYVRISQTIKVSSSWLTSTGDLEAMVLGVKAAMRDKELKDIAVKVPGIEKLKVYRVDKGKDTYGYIIFVGHGRATTHYMLYGLAMNEKEVSLVAAEIYKRLNNLKM